jgi:hypothetical protein
VNERVSVALVGLALLATAWQRVLTFFAEHLAVAV